MEKFIGDVYTCRKCEDLIQSSYPGEFVSCTCGTSFVDQTRHYVRCGGEAILFERIILEDFSKLIKTMFLVSIVENIDYGSNFIIGLFSTKEKAEEAGKRYCEEDRESEELEEERYFYIVTECDVQ